MGELLKGKKGIVMGVANGYSIAASVADYAKQEGAELGFSYLPDDTGKMLNRIKKVVDKWEPKLLEPCNVNHEGDIEGFFAKVKETYGSIDFLVHSIAFAPLQDIRCPTAEASRAGFLNAMETSVYSFMATALEASKVMNPGGSIVTMTYFGGEKVVPGYNVMGVVKAALDSATRYLAYDLGEKGIRVNALSAGAIKTLASSALGDSSDMIGLTRSISPMQRNIETSEVGKSCCYLLSDLSSAVTGDILHVDGGYHIMGSPGRALQTWNVRPRDF